MGSEQSVTNSDHSSTSRVHREMYVKINKQCQHINNVCSKHEDLKLLQTKLAILELQTVKGLKYSKTCCHTKCSTKAPNSFPDSDVFICSKHLQNVKQHFNVQISKKSNIKSHMGKVIKHGTNLEKQMIKSIYSSFMQVGHSFDGSVNNQAQQPQYYWSLLMTKLLTTLQFMKVSQSNATQVTEQQIKSIERLMQLLVIYRFVMNPIGEAILAFIVAAISIISNLTLLVSSAVRLINTMDAMVKVVLDSVVYGYAKALMTGLVNIVSNKKFVTGLVIVHGAAIGTVAAAGVTVKSVAAGVTAKSVITGIATTAAAAGPVGAAIGCGAVCGAGLIIGGTIVLIKRYRNNGANAVNFANQIGGDMTQNIQALQQNNNLQALQQQLQQLQQ